MKKLLQCIPLVLLLLLSGCVDFYVNVRPGTNANERWVSTDPQIFFVGWDEEGGGRIGEITLEDETVISIKVYFDYGIGMDIYRLPKTSYEDLIIQGDCKFSKDKLTVTITEDKENLLGDVDKITFIREEIENGEDG